MASLDMAKFGYVPAGSQKQSTLEQILSGVEAYTTSYTKSKEAKAKTEKEKIDTYINLRKAGYNEEEAFEALRKGIENVKPSGAGDFEKASDVKNRVKMTIYNKQKLTKKDYDYALREGLDIPEESWPEEVLTEQADKTKKKGQSSFGSFFNKLFSGKNDQATAKNTARDKEDKVREYLKSKGRKGTDKEVSAFLNKYPDFE